MADVVSPTAPDRFLEDAAAERRNLLATVIGAAPGGAVVDVGDGRRLLLPDALTTEVTRSEIIQHPQSVLMLRVLVVPGPDGRPVASQTDLLESLRQRASEKALADLAKGQVVEARITRLSEFGAYCTFGLLEGLIHIADLSWSHVDDPAEVVSVGERVSVVILDIDRRRKRILVGMKQTTPDPWAAFVAAHRTGDILEGRVVKATPFGLFIAVPGGVEGLLSYGDLRADDARIRGAAVGSTLMVRLSEVDPDRRRLTLALP